MNKLNYINCQFCGRFFSFEIKDIRPDNTVLLTCPSCNRIFSTRANPGFLRVPEPAQTASVDASNVFDELISES